MLPVEFLDVWLTAESLARELSDDAIEEARSVWGNTNTAIIVDKLTKLRASLDIASKAVWPVNQKLLDSYLYTTDTAPATENKP